MKTTTLWYTLLTLALRGALVLGLLTSAWIIYSKLPHQNSAEQQGGNAQTTLQIVLRAPDNTDALDIPVELYPFDIVAARHEYFTERRAGNRFDDFLKERMKGRAPVNAKLDKQGYGSVLLAPGSWWLHATISGDEQLEWRLPVTVTGSKQVIELTPQNAYTRSKTF